MKPLGPREPLGSMEPLGSKEPQYPMELLDQMEPLGPMEPLGLGSMKLLGPKARNHWVPGNHCSLDPMEPLGLSGPLVPMEYGSMEPLNWVQHNGTTVSDELLCQWIH